MSELKRVDDFRDVIGKTIKDVKLDACGDKFVLFFDDGEYLHIATYPSYHGESELFFNSDLGDYEKQSLGIISKAEYEIRLAEHERERQAQLMERELEAYKKLQAKYGFISEEK